MRTPKRKVWDVGAERSSRLGFAGADVAVAPPAYRPQSVPKVLQQESANILQSKAVTPGQAVQLTKVEATAYSEKYGLGLPTVKERYYHKKDNVYKTRYVITKPDAKNFIKNENKDIRHRRGLLRKWNNGLTNPQHMIARPENLIEKVVTKFTNEFNFVKDYDSSDDEEMNIQKTMEEGYKDEFTLVRQDGVKLNSRVFDLVPIIRIGRKIVRSDSYSSLPMIGLIGGSKYIEFNTPGTKDIYAYPLEKTVVEGKVYYRRSGGMRDFNWKTLSSNLKNEETDDGENTRPAKRRRIFGHFEGKKFEQVTSSEAEAIGAISCDWMKGSGNKTFVNKVLNIQDNPTFKELFCGTTPLYLPSKSEGRSEVTKETTRLKRLKRQKRKFDNR